MNEFMNGLQSIFTWHGLGLVIGVLIINAILKFVLETLTSVFLIRCIIFLKDKMK